MDGVGLVDEKGGVLFRRQMVDFGYGLESGAGGLYPAISLYV
jgi:hypothetical protein